MVRITRPRTLRVVIICACVGIVLGIGIWTSARILAPYMTATQELEATIVNKTKALEIVSTTKVQMGQEHVLRVTLKNVSAKNIVSYTYLAGHAGNTRSYAFSEKLFGPGETAEEYIPYEKLQTAATTSSEREDLVFAAVWFEGDSGDGDPQIVRQLRDESEGIKEQARRILPLLRKALRDPEIQEDHILTDLEAQISLLPTEEEAINQSLDYKQGRSTANRQLALRVQQLRENKKRALGINRKAEVTGNLASWERLLTRF